MRQATPCRCYQRDLWRDRSTFRGNQTTLPPKKIGYKVPPKIAIRTVRPASYSFFSSMQVWRSTSASVIIVRLVPRWAARDSALKRARVAPHYGLPIFVCTGAVMSIRSYQTATERIESMAIGRISSVETRYCRKAYQVNYQQTTRFDGPVPL